MGVLVFMGMVVGVRVGVAVVLSILGAHCAI